MKKLSLLLIVIFGLSSCNYMRKSEKREGDIIKSSVVEENGNLSIKGNQIVNKEGKPVSFAGNSLFWSNEMWSGSKFYNKEVVKWLHQDWNTEIVRCAMAVDYKVKDGYLNDPAHNIEKIEYVIDASIKLGIYVIIDWHSHLAHENEKEAIEFFKKMANKYGKYDNIIYEIFNEPLDVSWSNDIKPYAENVIRAIRKIDSDNLIVVGTPKWSQDVDIASEDPIVGFNDIAYAMHFYAGSHKQWLRDKTTKALGNGIAIFVTEWGTVDANGDGGVDAQSVKEWMVYMKKNNLSHCNWSVNDKLENASILYPGASDKGNWQESQITESGKLVKRYIKNWNKKD